LFLASGISGMLFFTVIDVIRRGPPNFGSNQLAGFVVSTIIVLACLRKTTSAHAKSWFGILLLFYIAGMLYMGLKPSSHYYHWTRQFLVLSRPPIGDFIVNILGFFPFAYIFMSYLLSGKRWIRTVMAAWLVLASGTGISLFIEIAQYYIPGRSSTIMDIVANTAGTMIGVAYFLIEKRISEF
jgi:VanZ family protein